MEIHGNDGDDSIRLIVYSSDSDRDGTDNNPAHSVDKGEKEEGYNNNISVSILSVPFLRF